MRMTMSDFLYILKLTIRLFACQGPNNIFLSSSIMFWRNFGIILLGKNTIFAKNKIRTLISIYFRDMCTNIIQEKYLKSNRTMCVVRAISIITFPLHQTLHNPFLCYIRSRSYYLRCDKNLPVEWPEPSQPGIGHLEILKIYKMWDCTNFKFHNWIIIMRIFSRLSLPKRLWFLAIAWFTLWFVGARATR